MRHELGRSMSPIDQATAQITNGVLRRRRSIPAFLTKKGAKVRTAWLPCSLADAPRLADDPPRAVLSPDRSGIGAFLPVEKFGSPLRDDEAKRNGQYTAIPGLQRSMTKA